MPNPCSGGYTLNVIINYNVYASAGCSTNPSQFMGRIMLDYIKAIFHGDLYLYLIRNPIIIHWAMKKH